MKRALVLLAACVLVTSFTGCSCCRRIRSTICPGAWCGSRAPSTAPVMSPIVTTPVVAAPMVATPQVVPQPQYVQPQQVIQPQVIQPQVVQPQMQMVAPQCVPCCPCPCPCPPVMCDPCCSSYDGFGSYGGCCGSGEMTYAGYGSDCGCSGSYGGEIVPSDGNWQDTRTPTDANTDPGPGT